MSHSNRESSWQAQEKQGDHEAQGTVHAVRSPAVLDVEAVHYDPVQGRVCPGPLGKNTLAEVRVFAVGGSDLSVHGEPLVMMGKK